MVELRWDGKYTKEGKKVAPVRIALPFQTVETVNESAQERQKMLDFFSDGKDPEWRNRLIWGDKKYVLPSLLEEFAGKVNLIYIDPPFATGADFSFTAQVPDDPDIEGDQGATFVKEPSILEQKAYRDTWGRGLDSFLQWFYETAVMLRELLAEDGSIYVHLDQNVSPYAKAILDELFGLENAVSEIVWKRINAKGNVRRKWGAVHETILFYSKNVEEFTWNQPLRELNDKYVSDMYRYIEEGTQRRYRLSDITAPASRASKGQIYEWKGYKLPANRVWVYAKNTMEELEAKGKIQYSKNGYPQYKRYLDENEGERVPDWWDDINIASSNEQVGYPTQKPEALLERIIKASSNEGDLVLDCFCGSGTTAAVAEKLGRRWITCDLGRFAIHTARKRLLGIPNVRPFTLQNLGKYERQAWQAAEFASSEDARLREARYRKFILDLYRAESITSGAWLHGVKLGRMVHVGAVDAPVTLEDVKAIARETWKRVGSGEDAPESAGVDILGWDFAFELNELGMQVAREAGVDVKFKKIPREVLEKKAVDQGDIKFFELAALTVDAKTDKKKVTLELKDFIIAPDDVPQEVMQAVTHWSQWVDYWAVDWDFKGDTFHNQWQSYRTKKQSKLELKASHMYEAPGEYTVLVKVIDLLGNDTTKAINIRIT
jgi:adenine-specific DNA-methyltransferase